LGFQLEGLSSTAATNVEADSPSISLLPLERKGNPAILVQML